MNIEELKFKLRHTFHEVKLVLYYFFKEPFYESKRLISGYYNSTLLFWASLVLYIYLWKREIFGTELKVAGMLVFISYFYMFYKSGKWKEYYKKEFIEGEKIK